MAKRILIVDDDRDVLEALSRAISLAGYSVTRATSAQEALALCKDHSFDLVVVDFIMPRMSGLEVLNRIRAIHPMIRSVVVSGKVDPALKEDEVQTQLKVEVEADAYLGKPVRNDRLVQEIERVLTLGKDQKWEDVAKRMLSARKTGTQVKKTEKSLRAKKPPRSK